jgi:hypothetical protein
VQYRVLCWCLVFYCVEVCSVVFALSCDVFCFVSCYLDLNSDCRHSSIRGRSFETERDRAKQRKGVLPCLSCLVLSCLVLSCLVLSCLVLSCPVLSCLILSYLILSCPVLSYLILSYLVLSFLVLPCLILSVIVFFAYRCQFHSLFFWSCLGLVLFCIDCLVMARVVLSCHVWFALCCLVMFSRLLVWPIWSVLTFQFFLVFFCALHPFFLNDSH